MTGLISRSFSGAAIEAISAAVANGDKVTLPGFGTFESRERSARTGRNPQTGAEISIPAERWGEPAGAAVFLASRAPAYVTGTTLTVDGGRLGR